MAENEKYASMIDMDTNFYQKVYECVGKIPVGKVATYGKIAELAGYPNAPREVGLAMARVHKGMNLPCHRVVNKKGTLAPDYVFGGIDQQKALLLSEGITFTSEYTINMPQHEWQSEYLFEQLSLL